MRAVIETIQEQRETMPFQPGVSGNPGGRPKGAVSLVQIMLKKLAEEGIDGRTRAEIVAEKAIEKAEAGDFQMFNAILERTDGKVPQQVDLKQETTTREEKVMRIKSKLQEAAAKN